MAEAADHHNRRARAPSEPGQSARQSNEEFGMFEPARPLDERPVPSLVLSAVGDVIEDETSTMHRFLINADNTVASIFEKTDDFEPTSRVVPILCLCRALHADADIRLWDRPAVVGDGKLRRCFSGIDAENITGRSV